MGMNQPNIWHSEYKSYIQIYDTIKNSHKKYISSFAYYIGMFFPFFGPYYSAVMSIPEMEFSLQIAPRKELFLMV